MTPARDHGRTRAPDRRSGTLTRAVQTYGAEISVGLISLANALITARALGVEGRGELVFLTAIAYLVSGLSTLGVQEANVNLASAEPRLRRALASNSVVLSVCFGALAMGVVVGLVALVPAVGGAVSSGLLLVTLGFLPVLILHVYLRFLIQGEYGFGVTNLAWLLPALVALVLNAALAIAGVLTLSLALGTWLLGQGAATAVVVWYVARRGAGFGRPDLSLAWRTLAFGTRSHIGRVMLIANYRLDQWILGALAGPRELGLYSIAVAWAEGLFLLPTALSAVQRPDLVRATREQAARHASRLFRIATVVSLPIAAALIVAAPVLCVAFFGDEFSGSVELLRVLALGAFGIIAMKQLGSALTARFRPLLASFATAVGFATTVALDVLLIPRFGALGASAASTLAYTIGGAVMAAVFVRALRANWRDLLPRVDDLRWLQLKFREARREREERAERAQGQRTTA